MAAKSSSKTKTSGHSLKGRSGGCGGKCSKKSKCSMEGGAELCSCGHGARTCSKASSAKSKK